MSLLFSIYLSAQIDTLLLPYDATSLTQEQQESNPSVLAYPTSMKDQMPRMKCNYDKVAFTIDNQGHKVLFSSGNLQFQPSTYTWRFAEHQWDFVGFEDSGNVYENGVKCNNSLISNTYNGWIDLFGWATSGWPRRFSGYGVESYDYYYWPTATADDKCICYKYYVGNSRSGSFEKGSGNENADWGVYNQIGSDPAGTWRTLSKNQWNYVINLRPNASDLCGFGNVNGVDGLILLPDLWQPIVGLSFIPSNTNTIVNNYSVADWTQMENNGAIFFPCAGSRCNTTGAAGVFGHYWSATPNIEIETTCDHVGLVNYMAYCLYFGTSINATATKYRSYGSSVRLVRDIED